MSKTSLTEEQIWELLEGHVDVLTPLAKKEEEVLKRSPCVHCGSYASQVEVNTKRPFSPNNLLVNKVIRCTECGVTFDPYSHIILTPPIRTE